jgi:hypothetical protein
MSFLLEGNLSEAMRSESALFELSHTMVPLNAAPFRTGFTDVHLADEIVTAAKARDYSINEFIQTLVRSEPFRKK